MAEQAPSGEAEIFIRYLADQKLFEAKLGSENAQSMEFPEDKVDVMLTAMRAENPKMVEVMDFLIREARKDPEGKWVSASNQPAQKGQALVGEEA